ACSQTSRPSNGVLPSMIGESWFGVLIISISLLLRTNQAQPEPKRPVAAFLNSSLNASKLPNLESILSATSPFGFHPPFGESTCKKKLWFECQPPLLRTAVRTFSGSASISLIISFKDLFSRSALPSFAAFKFVTYLL